MHSQIRGTQIHDGSIKRVDIELNYNDDGALRAEDIPFTSTDSIKSNISNNYLTSGQISNDYITSNDLILSNLGDVVLSGLVTGQGLKFDGSNWVNSTVSGGGGTISNSPFTTISGAIIPKTGNKDLNLVLGIDSDSTNTRKTSNGKGSLDLIANQAPTIPPTNGGCLYAKGVPFITGAKTLLNFDTSSISEQVVSSNYTWSAGGSPTYTAVGDRTAIELNGTNQYLYSPDNADAITAGSSFSVVFKLRFSTLPSTAGDVLQLQFDNASNYINIAFNYVSGSTYILKFTIVSAGSIITNLGSSSFSLSTDTTYLFAVLYDNTTITLVKDGVSIGSQVNSLSFANFTANIEIARNSYVSSYMPMTLIDYIMVKGNTFTVTQTLSLYTLPDPFSETYTKLFAMNNDGTESDISPHSKITERSLVNFLLPWTHVSTNKFIGIGISVQMLPLLYRLCLAFESIDPTIIDDCLKVFKITKQELVDEFKDNKFIKEQIKLLERMENSGEFDIISKEEKQLLINSRI